MSWLENNPVGAVLLGACGLLVLVATVLTFAWGGSVDASAVDDGNAVDLALPAMPSEEPLGPLRDYEVVINRPVFSDSRRPQVAIEAPEAEDVATPLAQQVADPPKVRLTGVVITPTQRVVTLTPEGGGEALVLREGMPLEGEFVGWSVEEVQPRTVRLASARGQQIDVELAVHDSMIAGPPTPEPVAVADAEVAAGDESAGETRSRADEIRERIRQRREELRAEAAQKSEEDEGAQEARSNAYQDAIRSMINRNNSGNDNDDNGDDGDS